MKWTLVFFILPCLPAPAATIVALLDSHAAGASVGSQLFVGGTLLPFDISDRSDLIPGLPILVSFTPSPFFGGITLQTGTSGTFRDVITIAAILGGQTDSVSSTFVAASGPSGIIVRADFAPFSLTVPWVTNLAMLSMSLTHDGSVDGNGIITWGGGVSNVTIATQSVPEPSAAALVIY